MSARGGGALFLDTVLNGASWDGGARRHRCRAGRGGLRARRPGPRLRRGAAAGAPRPRVARHGVLPRRRTPSWRRATRSARAASACSSSIGTCTTGTAPRRSWSTTRPSATSRCTSIPGIRARAWPTSAAWATSSTCRAVRGRRRSGTWRTSGPRSRPRRRGGRPISCSSPPGSTPCAATRSAVSPSSPTHYADLTRRLRERLPDVPMVGLLEGGYVPSRLADGVLAHVLALA